MTRAAVRTGFEEFVDDAIRRTAAEFNVARALRGGSRGPGGSTAERLLGNSGAFRRAVVEPELDAYRVEILDQFDVVLNYAESGDPIDAYREELLADDTYDAALRADLSADRRERIRDRLVERQRRLGDAVAVLVDSPETGFWDAVRAELDRETAGRVVEEQFAFTGPLEDHPDAFRMKTSFDPADVLGGVGTLLPRVEVEYTDEALRAMSRAERSVIADAQHTLDELFGQGAEA